MLPHLHVALPVMAEWEQIAKAVDIFCKSGYPDKTLWVCVNQPEKWHNDPDYTSVIDENTKTLQFLSDIESGEFVVIDNSSPGNGLRGKKTGVGMARKILMDSILCEADSQDIILSMDADTSYDTDYFAKVVDRLSQHPEALALSIPYYHPLPDDDKTARSILRYEIYMRYYALNMYLRQLPYARTALGSAMAIRAGAYRRVGGMTPHAGGEDFYMLQKLAKSGAVLDFCEISVFPEARFSERVPIGTGPAMVKGVNGDWSGYPFYPESLFDEVKETFDAFSDLYYHDVETPMSSFLKTVFKTNDLWHPLRKNYKTKAHFIQACMQKVDGLRIRQYMRHRYLNQRVEELNTLNAFLQKKYATFVPDTGFQYAEIAHLNAIRDMMYFDELEHRKKHDETIGL